MKSTWSLLRSASSWGFAAVLFCLTAGQGLTSAAEPETVPQDTVLVEVFEAIPDAASWTFRAPRLTETFTADAFAFTAIPNKVNPRGVCDDRTNPFLIRAWSNIELPAGTCRVLVRSRNASRLYVDGELIAQTPFHNISASGHGEVEELDRSMGEDVRALRRGDSQAVATLESDGGRRLFRFEMIVGGRKRRPEFGETSVSIGPAEGGFHLLAPDKQIPLTDAGWAEFVTQQRAWLVRENQKRRFEASRDEQRYWDWRHELALQAVSDAGRPGVPEPSAGFTASGAIDHFVNRRLAQAEAPVSRPTTDLEFLRRVTLDVIGTIPTPEQVEIFLADTATGRRTRWIDRLLESDAWADNWVGYWQDVLAENPNIVNPTLNNTGPFRWWIHESFLDNKPFDRFTTELIMMEGSEYFGGPAGFGLATQNDVPMAAKAHIVGQAFLALEMKCARCHDAPYHDFLQSDLFGLAGMLRRGAQEVPASSSIPGGEDAVKSLLIEVTLKPGEKVPPAWCFSELVADEFAEGVLRRENDSRERLAALVTSPRNGRSAHVIVNRLWKRYLGHGLVEPVDDWEYAEPSHPELLDHLAAELLSSGYDLKHVARLILNSHAYQRVSRSAEVLPASENYLFGSPIRRKMTAEQLVDSLFVAAGKAYDAGPMCIDIDGARPETSSLNLGEPTRAWQFASLSNERDRPSLALPFAQPFVTLMETFGWRSSRQDPLTERHAEPTVLQPAVLANGIIGRRITRLSDESAFVELALQDQLCEELVDAVFLRLLTRTPSSEERAIFRDLLTERYEQRALPVSSGTSAAPTLPRGTVSWSNHLNAQASVIKAQLEEAVRQGDPPTRQLDDDWRERLEDMVWVLVNSPEFVFLP